MSVKSRFTRSAKEKLEEEFEERVKQVMFAARRHAPVDTGRLMASIDMDEIEGGGYMVGSDVYYARFVEFGTSRMEAQPFLRPAAHSVFPSAVQVDR